MFVFKKKKISVDSHLREVNFSYRSMWRMFTFTDRCVWDDEVYEGRRDQPVEDGVDVQLGHDDGDHHRHCMSTQLVS